MKKVPQLTQQDKDLSSSIMLAIELDSSFRLYSFKIISHEQYISRTKELVQHFNKSRK